MENVTVGRIVHVYSSVPTFNSTLKCRAFIITDVHSPTTVSGQVILSPSDRRGEEGTDAVTSVVEEMARTETREGHEEHDKDHWHDPRLC